MNFAPALIALLALSQTDAAWFSGKVKQIEPLLSGDPALARKAMPLLDDMEKEAKKKKHLNGELYAQSRRGRCEALLGKYAQARKTLEKAIATTRAPAEHILLFAMRRDLGEYCLRRGHVHLAADHLPWALRRGQELHEKKTLSEQDLADLEALNAQYLLLLGKTDAARAAARSLGERIKAAKKQSQAAKTALAPGWWRLDLEQQGLMVELTRQAGDTVGAIDLLSDGLTSLVNPPDALKAVANQMRLNYHLGLVRHYRDLTRFPDAQDHLDKAAEYLEHVSTARNEADLNHARAGLLFEEVCFDFDLDGIVPNRTALAGGSNAPVPKVLASLHTRLEQAEALVRKALTAAEEPDDPDIFVVDNLAFLAQIHERLAQVQQLQGEAKKAARTFALARSGADKAVKQFTVLLGPTHDMTLQARRRRAWLNLREGELNAARREAVEVLAQFEKSHDKSDVGLGDFLGLLLEIEERAGNLEAAARYAERVRRLSASHLVRYLGGLTATEQVKFFRVWDDPSLHGSLRLGLRSKDDALRERAAEWLLNGKAKIAEVMAQINQQGRGDSERAKEFQACVQRQASLRHGFPGDSKSHRDALLREEKQKRPLTARWAKAAPSQPWHSLSELRKKLAGDEVFIDVFRTRPERNVAPAYYAWVITPRAVHLVELGDAARIDQLIGEFVDHQAQFLRVHRLKLGRQGAEKLLHEKCLEPLSRLVFDPLRKRTGASKDWVVSPDGRLWDFPWAAFLLPKSGKYAVEEIGFRYVVSGRDLGPKPAGVKPGDPWIVANPDFNRAPEAKGWAVRRRFPSLPGAEEEGAEVAECLASYFKGKSSVQNERVTKTALSRLAAPPRILYLATHAFLSPPADGVPLDDPLLSCGFLLAGGNYAPQSKTETPSLPGLMTGAEVLALDLRGTELVVLSACESGKRVAGYGQSPADLRHSFHLAGSRAVVSSLWQVEDEHTQALMVQFMRSLIADKLARAAALNDAQRRHIKSLRSSSDRHAHPFFWAAFTLSGS